MVDWIKSSSNSTSAGQTVLGSSISGFDEAIQATVNDQSDCTTARFCRGTCSLLTLECLASITHISVRRLHGHSPKLGRSVDERCLLLGSTSIALLEHGRNGPMSAHLALGARIRQKVPRRDFWTSILAHCEAAELSIIIELIFVIIEICQLVKIDLVSEHRSYTAKAFDELITLAGSVGDEL